MKKLLFSLALLLVHTCALSSRADDKVYDVVIYGPTSAGVAAAVQAARMGKTVVVVGPDKHLGGLSAGGLGWTDSGNKAVIGGIAREFYQRMKRHYDRPEAWTFQKPEQYSHYRPSDDAMWVFEPHVAEDTFEQMIAEAKVPVFRDRWLDRSGKGVLKDGARITAITMLNGETYRGRVFIDATYEGDLMAAAGVSHTVGRESNSTYGETLNGVQTAHALSHQFDKKIDPYVTPSDPSSGLLPRIHDGGPGKEGEGDNRVQAYNYRICMTRVPENRVPWPKPEGYDPGQYELLLRFLLAGSRHVFGKIDPAPNNKTDTNNHGAFSTDNIGMNYDYPDASYERRREILEEHRRYQQGYHYFLANDPRVPDDVRKRYAEWGLAKDEFTDNGNWPHQIYVREARRMVSDFVMTELHLRRIKPTPKPIGMGSYNMDSHNTQRYVAHDKNGKAYVLNEGDVEVNPGGPYPVSYEAIVPRKSECENLLVPVCLSSSHIAYGSIRMEPVFLILGQSAATAAAIAVGDGVAVQDVSYDKLSERLLADKQVLEFKGPTGGGGRGPHVGLDPKKLVGVVVDDADAKRTGQWLESASVGGFVGKSYLHDNNENKGRHSIRFEAKVSGGGGGRYQVRISYTANPNRATNVPVTVELAGKTVSAVVNEKKTPPIDGTWIAVATADLAANETVAVTISNADTDGFVIVDAIQIVPVR
jgi:FAD dependent oxidoreductase